MDPEAPKQPGKYKKYAFVLLFGTTLTLYMLYAQTYAQLRQNSLLGALDFPGFKESSRYLVKSSKCRIPNLNPFSDDIDGLYKINRYHSCTSKPLLSYLTLSNTQAFLHINETVIHNYTHNGIVCCYSYITRPEHGDDRDEKIKASHCRDFKSHVNLTEDVVIVECKDSVTHKELYKNVHVAVTVRDNIKKKLKTAINSKPLSVLFVGIDSVSRLNFIRQMPSTYSFLKINNWIEMRGYNKIGDNTFPNLMAIFTGNNESKAYAVCKPVQQHLDTCKLIWQSYKDSGFVTAYAEDECSITTFNYHKKGFLKPPTDYYFRTYLLAAEKKLKTEILDDMTFCTGPETSGERILNLAKDFVTMFQNFSYFGFFWMNTFSHNKLNSLSRMDEKVHKFLEHLLYDDLLQNTIVFFFSDHGLRFGKIRYTNTGWLEERLPILYLWLPQWFKDIHPEKYKNLELNQYRLTTPYDVHMTVQEILSISTGNYSVTPSNACPTCRSLFEEMERNRSCEDAAIEQHWCTCGGYLTISKSNATVKEATKFIISTIHTTIQSYGKEARKCSKYSVKDILSASISHNQGDWYSNNTYLRILLETAPDAVFEATVSVNSTNSKLIFQMQGSISRLDYYKPHSNCVDNGGLKKFCYCKR